MLLKWLVVFRNLLQDPQRLAHEFMITFAIGIGDQVLACMSEVMADLAHSVE